MSQCVDVIIIIWGKLEKNLLFQVKYPTIYSRNRFADIVCQNVGNVQLVFKDVTNFDQIQSFHFAFELCSHLRMQFFDADMVTIPAKFQRNEAIFYFKTFVF